MLASRFPIFLAAAVAATSVGCGGTPPAKPALPEPSSSATPADKPADSKPAATGIVSSPPATGPIESGSAVTAIRNALRSLEEGQLAQAYDFLPASYQADVDGLVHEFAGRMDPEVWASLLSTARKGIAVLREKKDDILVLDLFRDEQSAAYRKHWDSTLQLLQSVVDSDAGELSKLKQATARSLLPGKSLPQFEVLVRALGADLSRQLAGLSVNEVRVEGATQIISIQGPEDESPTEVVYVQHDGKWLPKSLVEHWAEGIAADRAWLQKLPDRIKAVKPRLLDALSDADQILDQLAAAGNREQFQQAAGPAILALATAWPNLQLLARQAMTGQAELPSVTVVINRELTEAELNKLTAMLLKPLQEAGSDYTLLSNDGRTICRMSRIDDIEALRDRLASHFRIDAEEQGLDRDAATIRLNLSP